MFYIFLELHDLPDAYTLQAATPLNSSKRGMKMKNKKWMKIPQFSKWAKQNRIFLSMDPANNLKYSILKHTADLKARVEIKYSGIFSINHEDALKVY